MRDFKAEDAAMRAKLERNSTAEQRVSMAAQINALAKAHDARAMPGLSAYGIIRLLQNDGAAQARAMRRHNLAHDVFERLHPDSVLGRAAERLDVPASEKDDALDDRIGPDLRAGRVPDADGSMAADARTGADKWDDRGVRGAEPSWLTAEQMAALRRRGSRRRGIGKGWPAP